MKMFDELLLVGGVPKAGTTSLFRGLKRTALAAFPSRKEPHYLCGQINRINRDPLFTPIGTASEYFSLFERIASRAVDCDPLTFQDVEAADRAFQVARCVKMAVVLRNPVDRLISHYRNNVRECVERRSLEAVIRSCDSSLGSKYPYVWHSEYAQWIELWQRKIGRHNLLFIRYDDVLCRPREMSDVLCNFFGLRDLCGTNLFSARENLASEPRNAVIASMLSMRGQYPAARKLYLKAPEVFRSYIRRRLLFSARPAGAVESSLLEALYSMFGDDIHRTAELLGWDLGSWLQPTQKSSFGADVPLKQQPSVKAALIWSQFGPYHHSRFQAVKQYAAGKIEVAGIAIGEKSGVYKWTPVSRDDVVVRFKGAVDTDIPAVRLFLRGACRFIREQYDVVFVPSYWPKASLALLVAARCLRIPAVMMNDTHELSASGRFASEIVKKVILRLFGAALVAGTPQRRYFVRLGMKPDRLYMGYDCIDNDAFETVADEARADPEGFRRKNSLPSRYFLYVGRFEWMKDLSTVLRAYALAKGAVANVPKLVLVGSGREEERLKEICAEVGLTWGACSSSNDSTIDVLFYGFVEGRRLAEIYALAIAFVFMSKWETWGLVVNEAMACGSAVIASSVAGCVEDLVFHERNGFLCPPGDVRQLSKFLVTFSQDLDLAAKMGAESRRIIGNWSLMTFCAAFESAARCALQWRVSEVVI
jgi:glycosyltransferase involved in cell wall biosynthesis